MNLERSQDQIIDTTIILITELIEQKRRKEEELEYYHIELEQLKVKAEIVEKALLMTRMIIDLIENERIRTIQSANNFIIRVITNISINP